LDRIKSGRMLVIVTSTDMSKVPPTLRSIGRLRRDLAFGITNNNVAAVTVLRAQTMSWKKKPSDAVLEEVAAKTITLSSEELIQLCRDAYLAAFQRQVPSVGNADTQKLNSEALDALEVLPEDWNTSLMSFKNALGQINVAAHSDLGPTSLLDTGLELRYKIISDIMKYELLPLTYTK